MPPDQQTLQDLNREVGEIHVKVDGMEPKLNDIHKALFNGGKGNGLVTRVALQEDDISNLQRAQRTARSRGWTIVQGVILSAIGASLALFGRWLLMP